MTKITAATTTFTSKNCHKGNTAIYKEPDGGTLFIGGWTNDATFNWNTHVIDLTGSEHKFFNVPLPMDDASKAFMPFLGQSYAGWLSLPFPDFGVPSKINTLAQWKGIAETIQNILKKGTDVLVACQGGHGRSGLFCSIVGYLLNIDNDRTWNSPVEKLRKLHCPSAVETYKQEKFVYDVLGLKITITQEFDDDIYPSSTMWNYKPCPICNTQSMFVDECGMCMGCQTKAKNGEWGKIPVRRDLTLKDIAGKGMVPHTCTIEKCMGIWKAEKCGHIVHDMVIYEGWCTACFDKHQDEIEFAESQLEKEQPFDGFIKEDTCAICNKESMYSQTYGICWDCQEEIIISGQADEVHNSITDPYRNVPHTCDSGAFCVGVVIADTCKHVVHNREIEDGLCPNCKAHKLEAR